MGNSLTSAVEDKVKGAAGAMQDNQRRMALKQRETEMAVRLAQAKDRFHFYTGFYCTVWFFGSIGAIKFKNPAPLVGPLIPTTWAWAYQYDMIYGDKMQRITDEANRMMMEEPEKFKVPYASLLLPEPDYYDKILQERMERNELIKNLANEKK